MAFYVNYNSQGCMTAPTLGNLLSSIVRVSSENLEIDCNNFAGYWFSQAGGTSTARELGVLPRFGGLTMWVGGKSTDLFVSSAEIIAEFGSNTIVSELFELEVNLSTGDFSLYNNSATPFKTGVVDILAGRVDGCLFRLGGRGNDDIAGSTASAFLAPPTLKTGNTKVVIDSVLVRDYRSDGVGSDWEEIVSGQTGTLQGLATDGSQWTSYVSPSDGAGDTTAPVITINPAQTTYNLSVGDTFAAPVGTSTDAVDGTQTITPTGTVDTNTEGTYTLTYSDSDAAGNAATPVIVTVNVSAAVTGTIAISNPSKANRVYQRDENNQYQASFDVTYTGADEPLYFQLLNALDDSVILDYTVFDATPTLGVSTLNITRSASIVEYKVRVRKGTGAVVDTQTLKWSVGILAIGIGQSLMEHLQQQDVAAMPANLYDYTNGSFTTTSGNGQRTWASRLSSIYNCTVAIMNTAVGATCLTSNCAINTGQSTNYWENETSNLWQNTLTEFAGFSEDQRIEYVAWMQAGTDSRSNPNYAEYLAAQTTFFSRVRNTFRTKDNLTGDNSGLKIIQSTAGRNVGQSDAGRNQIRKAILAGIANDPDTFPIPVFPYGYDDGVHPNDAGDTAIGNSLADVYSGILAPEVNSVTLGSSLSKLVLNYSQDLEVPVGNYDLEGVRVLEGATLKTITSMARTGIREVEITLSSALSNTSDVSVYLCYGVGTTNNLLNYPTGTNGLFTIPLIAESLNIPSDTTAPVITINPTQTTYNLTVGDSFTAPTGTSTDAVSGTKAITPTGSVNANVVGTYTLTYSDTDAAGNVATPIVVTVNVAELSATLNMSLTGLPDGTYNTRVINATTSEVVFSGPKAWVSEASSLTGLILANGTELEYYVIGATEGGLQRGVTV